MIVLCNESQFRPEQQFSRNGGKLLSHLISEAREIHTRTIMTEAFQSVKNLDEQDVRLSREDLAFLLQACTQKRDLAAARRVHFFLIRRGLDSNGFLGDHLIRLFALCGSSLEAKLVFCRISKANVNTWNAIIQAHASLHEKEKAIGLYCRMWREGIECDRHTFLCVLRACKRAENLLPGRFIHVHVIRIGLDSDRLVGSALINMYAKCGSLEEAYKVFNLISCDVVSWGAMIGGYAQHGHGLAVFELYQRMLSQGLKPNKVIFLCVLKACGTLSALFQGRLIHEQIIRNELESDRVIANTIVDMYSKGGSVDEACTIFDKLVDRDVVSWSAMIYGYAQNGYALHAIGLHKKMQQEGVRPNETVFLCALKACSSVETVKEGRLIHDQIIRDGFQLDVVVGSTLVDMYAKCGSLEEAHKVFDQFQHADLIAWGAIITGYAQHGHDLRALDLLSIMIQKGLSPDKAIIVSVLAACANIGAIHQGRFIHEQIIMCELKSEEAIGCSLINMYGKCGGLMEAHNVFSYLANASVMSYAALMGGYTENGHNLRALELFLKMQDRGVKPDKVVFLSVLRASSSMGTAEQGRLVHNEIFSHGLELDVVIGSSLVNMYAKHGSLEEATKVFGALPFQNLVSWGAMILGHCQHGNDVFALELFEEMQENGFKPDRAIVLSILKACASLGAFAQGRLIHDQAIRSGLNQDDIITNTLIEMYAKCGCLMEAHDLFSKLSYPDLVSWGTLIAGYAIDGNSKAAGQCLEGLLIQSLKPDDAIYTGILTACSHSGLLHLGLYYFRIITAPYREHFNCVVDLLSRAGYLKEAEDMLETMPIPSDLRGWVSLLAGCKTYHDFSLGRKCFDICLRFDADNASEYMLMSSIYCDSHMWEDANGLQDVRKNAGVPKKPGTAWIEAHQKVHEFTVGNETKSQDSDIYAKLKRLYNLMKKPGYVAKVELILDVF